MSIDVYPAPEDVILGTMAQQDANAVAITGGTISLGGHAPTGVLDVQSLVESEFAQNYFGVRIWPRVTTITDSVAALRIEATTFDSGSSFSGGAFYGIQVLGQPAGAAAGLYTDISAGTGRHNIYAAGTAPNYFAGNVGIAIASPQAPLHVDGTVIVGPSLLSGVNAQMHFKFDKSVVQGLTIQQIGADTGGGQPIGFNNVAGTNIGSISSSGTGVSFNTTSDVRLKYRIETLVGPLAAIMLLNPVSFLWNADDSPGVGFLAHELQQVIPEAVTGEPDAINDDGTIRPQQVDHSRLIPWLVGAVQELAARVESLETQLGL